MVARLGQGVYCRWCHGTRMHLSPSPVDQKYEHYQDCQKIHLYKKQQAEAPPNNNSTVL